MTAPEERFRKRLLELGDYIHDLISYCWTNNYKLVDPCVVKLALDAIATYEKSFLIETFIKYSQIHWEKIRLKDERFFIEDFESIFHFMSQEKLQKMDLFKRLLELKKNNGEPALGKAARNAIWMMLHILVKASIEYLREHRELQTDSQVKLEVLWLENK